MKEQLKKLAYIPILGAVDHIVDNYLFNSVEPVRGSVVYVDLFCSYIEHSGIYIGDGKIVHLRRKGVIEVCDSAEFMEGTTALRIYVSSNSDQAVGSEKVAQLAESKIGHKINYSVLTNNCHKFSAGCVTGNFDNSSLLLTALKSVSYETLGAKDWRVWKKIKR